MQTIEQETSIVSVPLAATFPRLSKDSPAHPSHLFTIPAVANGGITNENRRHRPAGHRPPIFAFSHCRDVVVEVSKAGGMGVLGAAGFDPEHLEEEMQWIDSRIGGKPYGVDVLIPNTYAKVGTSDPDLDQLLPQEQRRLRQRLCDDAGLPPLPVGEAQELIQKKRGNST